MNTINRLLRNRGLLLLAVLGGLALLRIPAQAFEEIGPPPRNFSYVEDRGSVHLGAMHVYLNTQIQLNRNNLLPGTFFDFENDLGLEGDQMRLFTDATYRIGKHASFRLAYLEIARSNTKTISKNMDFGNIVFAANSTVTAFVNSRTLLFNYQYTFVRNSKQEFGATLGANIADISVGMRSSVSASGPLNTVTPDPVNKEVSVLAPTPLVGIFLSTQILPRTFFRNTIQYMDLDVGGYAFKALNYIVGFDYNPMPNFGIGAGVYSNRIQVDKGGNIDGRFITQVTGSQVYLRYFF